MYLDVAFIYKQKNLYLKPCGYASSEVAYMWPCQESRCLVWLYSLKIPESCGVTDLTGEDQVTGISHTVLQLPWKQTRTCCLWAAVSRNTWKPQSWGKICTRHFVNVTVTTTVILTPDQSYLLENQQLIHPVQKVVNTRSSLPSTSKSLHEVAKLWSLGALQKCPSANQLFLNNICGNYFNEETGSFRIKRMAQ